jgi:O-antigen/teichoic acid export membrane protein
MMESIATNIAAIKAKSGEAAAAGVFRRLSTRLCIVFLVPALALIIFSHPVAAFFHLAETGPVILLAVSLFAVLLINLVLGFLQGLQMFRQMGVTGYLTAQGMKLLAGVVFVWIGWGLMGAVGALLAATLLGTLVGLALLRKKLAGAGTETRLRIHFSHIFIPTLLLAVFLSVPASVDVMLVTHYFGGEDAGLYNATATLGKIIVFLPMAVSLILLPKATESHALGMDTRKILMQGFVLTLGLSGLVAIILWALPDFIINLFFGEDYIEAGAMVGLYSLAMLIFSLNVLLTHYSLATQRLWLMAFTAVVTVLEVLVIVMVHWSITGIIWVLILGNLLILMVNLPVLVIKSKQPYTR